MWLLVQGLGTILFATIFIFWIFLQVLGSPIGTLDPEQIDITQILAPEHQVVLELLMTIILAPLWTGIAMTAILSFRGDAVSFPSMLKYYSMFTLLAVASAITSILLTLGFALYFIPGLYLFMATTFTLPLIIERRLTPFKAIALSIRAVNANFGKIISFFAIFLLLFVLVIISFGIAYIFVGPLYFNVKAILYQNLFCNTQPVHYINKEQQGVFDA